MEIKYYYSSVIEPFNDDRNGGIKDVPELLTQIENKGVKCQKIDTSQLTDEQIYDAYVKSVVGPTQLKKYKVRQVFGSARHSGWLFGRRVPALVVYTVSSKVPEDVFPHSLGGRIMTVKEGLSGLMRILG